MSREFLFSYTPKRDYEVKEETKFDPKRPEGQRRYKVSYKYYTDGKYNMLASRNNRFYYEAMITVRAGETTVIDFSIP